MKLDSEEQRKQLLELLSAIEVKVTFRTLDATKNTMLSIINPIRNAEIEQIVEEIIENN